MNKCSICGCEQYTKYGNTAGGKWVFVCSNGHKWHYGSTIDPFPWLDNDPHHPKHYAWDLMGNYKRKDDPTAFFRCRSFWNDV